MPRNELRGWGRIRAACPSDTNVQKVSRLTFCASENFITFAYIPREDMSTTTINRPPRAPLAEVLERELVAIVGRDGVMTGEAELRAYDCDAYAPEKHYPDAVVLPENTEQVSRIVKLCTRLEVPFTP